MLGSLVPSYIYIVIINYSLIGLNVKLYFIFLIVSAILIKNSLEGSMVAKTAKEGIKRKIFSVVMDPVLIKQVRIRAAQDETTISNIVESAIKAFLTKKK